MQKKSSHNDSNKKLLFSLFIIFLTGGWIIFGPYGAIKYFNLQKELADIQAQNEKMKEENDSLRKEIDKLSKDRAYIEEIARKKLGLIRKNEFLFAFEEKKKKKHDE